MYLWVEGESWILRVGGRRKGYGLHNVQNRLSREATSSPHCFFLRNADAQALPQTCRVRIWDQGLGEEGAVSAADLSQQTGRGPGA